MKHQYYNKPKHTQIKIQISIAGTALLVLLISLAISWLLHFYIIAFLALPIVISIIAPFFDVPSLKKSGKIVYYSSLFLTEQPKNNIMKVHGGSLFDYVYVLNFSMNGKQRTSLIIQQYLEGLLNLIEHYNNGTLKNYTIKGTSYIINKRTAKKIGFDIVETNFIDSLVLIYNFPNILLSNSISKNRFSIPKLHNINTYQTDLEKLSAKKEYISALNIRLKRNI
ncbi:MULTISPECIES: hypothetical protein [Galbibacter]|uniref:Uncharacterized protein n=1 Tax=Galbibacter pacificus TaxID=2996052 RepID=A0ABT6FPD5_9FLAO|nr:hypothetical protein [Galbibacter pacificus]MDG3581640.1 hypothetical protein [Galbibacter pacificus]MDG3585118.1 hypothetical protein [Galbibacter pacificus]